MAATYGLQAGPSVPSWFAEQVYDDVTEELEASALARENAALDCLFDGGICVRDKQDDAPDSCLHEIARSKEEFENWDASGFV